MKRIPMYFVSALLFCLVPVANALAYDLDEALAGAAYECNSQDVRALIAEGANVNATVTAKNGKGYTILEYANEAADEMAVAGDDADQSVYEECEEVIRILKEAGAR